MPNPYVPTTWVDGVTAITAIRLNNMETGISDASTTAYAAIPAPSSPASNNVLVYSGGAWTKALLVNANIDAAAVIAVTKLALGAANTVLQSDGAANSFSTTTGANARIAVKKNSAATTGTRRAVNLIEGSGIQLTVTDDSGGEKVDVTIASTVSSSITIQKDGSIVGARPTINLITGDSTSLTVADNSGSNRVDVTVAATVGRGSSLPTPVADGSEYNLTQGSYPNIWRFKYNSGAARWDFIGGSPVYVDCGSIGSSDTGWHLTTSYSVPRPGAYFVQWGYRANPSGYSNTAYGSAMGIAVNGAGSPSGKAANAQGSSYYSGGEGDIASAEQYTVNSGQTIRGALQVGGGSGSWSVTWVNIWFSVIPIYVT